MNKYLAINPPKWRDAAFHKLTILAISPKPRQSGEIKSIALLDEGINKGITEGVNPSKKY